jgi:hypothetical protein
MSQSKIKSRLTWLGVGTVVAACLMAASAQVDGTAFAQVPSVTHVQTTVCRGAAGQQVSASASGQPQGWAATALNTLCNGAETSTGPGQCFSHVMTSNSVNYGTGTAWNANNALRLCAGASDAHRRISCFEGKIAQRVAWSAAIDQCVAEERTLNAQVITPTAPRVTTPVVRAPAAPSGAREPTLEEVHAIRMEASNRPAVLTCTGPLRVQLQQRDPNDARSPVDIAVLFRPAASATSVAAGQCWRTGGWGNGALIHMDGEGVINHYTVLGPCAFLRSLRFENGTLADVNLVDSYPAGAMLQMARAGSHTVETMYGGGITDAGSPRAFNAQRAEYGTQPSHCVNR